MNMNNEYLFYEANEILKRRDIHIDSIWSTIYSHEFLLVNVYMATGSTVTKE